MKIFRIFFRDIRDSFKSVFRNFSLSIASISSITITLLVVAIAVILSQNVNNFASLVEKDVTIVTFLDVNITDEETNDVEDEIKELMKTGEVASYTYQSKTSIAKEMMESSEVFDNIMKDWTEEENPLQSTFQIKVVNIEKIGEIANKIKKFEHVNNVKYGEGMVEQLISLFKIIRNVSVGAVVALILVTAFLIANTIKITIYSRKREIEIMRLVGASNLNIKIPFFFEGLILGLIGAIIPVCATVYGYVFLYRNFDGKLFSPFIKLIQPTPFVYYVSGLLLLVGMVVGMLGSLGAVKRYLKI